MLMCITILVIFCQLVLKILSGNEILISIKGRYSVVYLRNLMLYNPNLDINICKCVYKNLGKFCPLVLKILSGNEILTSTKGHNSVENLRKMTLYNPNLDLINVNLYTKFGYILSIGSQDIERKRNSDVNQGA